MSAITAASDDEMQAEIERLRQQMERQKDEWLSWEAKRRALEAAASEAERLRAENDSLKQQLAQRVPDELRNEAKKLSSILAGMGEGGI